jgi:hypothetical protein
MKMYVAVGPDEGEFEYSGDRSSPYWQSAKLFFARGDKEAQRRAMALLGNRPEFVQQVGAFEADLTRTNFDYTTESKARFIFVRDHNDTKEGAMICVNVERDGKCAINGCRNPPVFDARNRKGDIVGICANHRKLIKD